jgi:hypothetical protein
VLYHKAEVINHPVQIFENKAADEQHKEEHYSVAEADFSTDIKFHKSGSQ